MRWKYLRSGEGFLLVYSITSRDSFEFVTQLYREILRAKDKDSFPVVLVATKSDLEFERQVGISGTAPFSRYIVHLMTWNMLRSQKASKNRVLQLY
jgi:hypothetical protein